MRPRIPAASVFIKLMTINAILATKKTMVQTWDKNGQRLPITIMAAGPCLVTQIKSLKTDRYSAVQLGLDQRRLKTIVKPQKGHLKPVLSQDQFAPRYLREIRLASDTALKVGDTISVADIFEQGDVVNVTGTTKGRGFSGVVKRWGFKGGPRTHGQSDRERAPGSIGQGTNPGRIHKGKKMPGHYGATTKTIKKLLVVKVDSQNNELWVKGPVPGPRHSLLIIKKTGQTKFPGLIDQTKPLPTSPSAKASSSPKSSLAIKPTQSSRPTLKKTKSPTPSKSKI
jgi:large subunit ribosomal protein L3